MSSKSLLVGVLSLIGASLCAVEPKDVPELMKTFSGQAVTSLSQWQQVRAPEILERFRSEVYGHRPSQADERKRISFEEYDVRDAMDGRAIRKLVRVNYDGPTGKFTFPVTVFIPKASKPVGAFVFICNRSRSNVDADRSVKSPFWPAEEIVERGYATATFLTVDVAADAKKGFAQGIFPAVESESERTETSWATLSAWAWAASRVLDWFETEKLIDEKRVAVVGHSRGGKTAIWAGVNDTRFAMVCSNNSGCSRANCGVVTPLLQLCFLSALWVRDLFHSVSSTLLLSPSLPILMSPQLFG